MLKFQTYTDARGEYRWRLLAGNNETIATSGEGYRASADCKHAIELIRSGAASATIVEESKASTAKAKAVKTAKAKPAAAPAAAASAAPKPKTKTKSAATKAAPKADAPKARAKKA